MNSGVARFVKSSVELFPKSGFSTKSAALGTDGGDTSTTTEQTGLVLEKFPAESIIT